MSVGLGELTARDDRGNEWTADVSAADYSADRLEIQQGEDCVALDRKQLQELTTIIDRFLDN